MILDAVSVVAPPGFEAPNLPGASLELTSTRFRRDGQGRSLDPLPTAEEDWQPEAAAGATPVVLLDDDIADVGRRFELANRRHASQTHTGTGDRLERQEGWSEKTVEAKGVALAVQWNGLGGGYTDAESGRS